MGWGRTLLLGDIGNRLDVEDCEREIHRLKGDMRLVARVDRSQTKGLREVQKENEQLRLYMAALVRLLVAKGVVSADELGHLIDVVDEGEDEEKVNNE